MNTISSPSSFQTILAIVIAAAALTGCASVPAPNEQMAVSKAAIANAASAGGAQYASPEMRSAQEKMDRAQVALQKEDYESARWLAEEAQVDARLAEKKAHSAKARNAALATGEDIRVLREEINRRNP